jgi:hypothetical protein
MIRLAKRMVLQGLDRAGYRLLRRDEHDRLLETNAHFSAPPAAPSFSPGSRLALSDLAAPDAAPASFLEAVAAVDVPASCAVALYSIADYLTRAGIEGDIVDCGYGTTRSLAMLATAFVHIGDTTRRLILFDTSADPTHRPEFEFELWGATHDLLCATHPLRRVQKQEPPPRELVDTGYPAANFAIRRYPRELIAQSAPVALLGVTSATYEANRMATAVFFPKLSAGGVIVVSSDPLERSGRSAADEFLRETGIHLLLLPVGAMYRVGVKR